MPNLRLWANPGQTGWFETLQALTLDCHRDDPLVRQLAQFCDVIRGTAAPLVRGEDGLAALEVQEAIKTA